MELSAGMPRAEYLPKFDRIALDSALKSFLSSVKESMHQISTVTNTHSWPRIVLEQEVITALTLLKGGPSPLSPPEPKIPTF